MIEIQVQNPLTGLWTTVQTVGQDSSVGLHMQAMSTSYKGWKIRAINETGAVVDFMVG
jgi:hypothetical protein